MKFSVPDMSCGHCAATIEKAVKTVDASASVACDLETSLVEIGTSVEQKTIMDGDQQGRLRRQLYTGLGLIP